MKYRVEYPIKLDCNLQCYYCFHSAFHRKLPPFEDGKQYNLAFTVSQWRDWRDKFLCDAEEILIMFHGGEPFVPSNVELIVEFIDKCQDSVQRYEFLTNGVCERRYYKELERYKDKIMRVGFTFHRRMLSGKSGFVSKFMDNLLFVKSMGIPVYVKELLRLEDKRKIIEFKKFLVDTYNIELKIQDYKGGDRGLAGAEEFSYDDYLLIDREYRHSTDMPCECLRGYKGIAVYGYDEISGNVIACWRDPAIVGNIQDMWFDNNFFVSRKNGRRDVQGVRKRYFGINRDIQFKAGDEALKDTAYKKSRQAVKCNSETEMLALDAKYGDMCERLDEEGKSALGKKIYVLYGSNPKDINDWAEVMHVCGISDKAD